MVFHLLLDLDSWPCISFFLGTPGGSNGHGDWDLDNAALGSLEAAWAPLSHHFEPNLGPPKLIQTLYFLPLKACHYFCMTF